MGSGATIGQFTVVDVRAAFCGPGRLDGNGDARVGDAVIDGSLLSARQRAVIADAEGQHACAVVRTQGTIDSGTGQLSLTTQVRIRVAAEVSPIGTAPPTDTIVSSRRDTSFPIAAVVWALLAISVESATLGR